MSLIIRRIFRYATQKAASDPRVREKARQAAQFVADEAMVVARDKDRARAAGRSLRRTLNMLQGKSVRPRK